MEIMVSSVNSCPAIYYQYSVQTGRQSAPHKTDERKISQVRDKVSISSEDKELSNADKVSRTSITGEGRLTEEEKREVDRLKQTDREVKAHERAHMSAGAGLVMGGASYQYEKGPDGKMYAVGGDVKIDVSPEKDPEATIRKMEQLKRAALAPSQPSSTDRAVAAQASQVEAQARIKLAKEKRAKAGGQDIEQGVDILKNLTMVSTNPYDSQPPENNIDLMI